ncbi:MAG TPA: LmeA family phospholipid-binding protein [Elusimicrobiota bacterium]|nr:LmeA family phospholipid-binding protein [Elusimicrobiota bacterium]
MSQAPRRRLTLAAGLCGLALFLGWEALALKAYVRQDNAPPSWNQAEQLSAAWDYRRAFEQKDWSVLWTRAPGPGETPFAPLYPLAAATALSLPKPAQAALLVNWLYLTLLCLCVFGIAWEFRPDLTALAATLIFAGAPAAQNSLFTQLPALAATALAAAAYWALIRSEHFKRWPASLAFGAVFALGMLHQWSFFAYLFPAFWVAGQALRDAGRRPKALAALALALAGFAPWTLAAAPLFLPALVRGSAGGSAVLHHGGVFDYFRGSVDALGLPFFLLGWLALLSPQHKRRWDSARLLPAWIGASYLFWTLAPGGQMRFLLPGLPALAVCAASAWPEILVWPLAGFQLLSAANFPAGFIPPLAIPTPLGTATTLLPSRPPSSADWKIADILEAVDKRRAPREPFADAALVADAPKFNPPAFAWTAKVLGLSGVNVRAAGKRLRGFSQFVILKEGSPEPPAARISDPRGWFKRAYVPVRSWPLPDGSQAVLFAQRRLKRAPFGGRAYRFQFYRSGPLSAKNLRVDLGPWDARAGDYPRILIQAPQILFHGLALAHVALELDDARLVPVKDEPGRRAWDDVRFLRAGRLKIVSARISADDLALFLENRVKKLDISSLTLDAGVLSLQGKFSFIPVSAAVRVALDRGAGRIDFKILSARAAGVSLPAAWLARLAPPFVSLAPTPEIPFAVDPGDVTLKGGRLLFGGG